LGESCRRESFNGKLRNELLDAEIFYTQREAQVLIEEWRQHYNASGLQRSGLSAARDPGTNAHPRVSDKCNGSGVKLTSNLDQKKRAAQWWRASSVTHGISVSERRA
jgi:hypothetical protein